MAVKTISLEEGVYRKLLAEKRPGESFSDVVRRLLEAAQPPPGEHEGAEKPLSSAELRKLRARVERLRQGTPEG
jgi:predicted CopG family antitoxin